MEKRELLLLMVFGVLFALASWFLRWANDEQRIRRYITARGGNVISIKASASAFGLLFSWGSRIYAVRYIDQAGNEQHARCNTSGWIGVFLADAPVNRPSENKIESLEEENHRLREENETLRRRLGDKESTAIKEP